MESLEEKIAKEVVPEVKSPGFNPTLQENTGRVALHATVLDILTRIKTIEARITKAGL